PDCGEELLRLLERRTVTAPWQLDVSGARDLLNDLLVEDRWRRLIEFATHNQRRHFEAMELRHEIRLLQDLARGLESLRIDRKQDVLALLDLFGMRGEIGRREHTLRGDLGNATKTAFGDFLRHHRQGLSSFQRKDSRCIAQHQLRYALGMRKRKCQS